jgi:carbon-monoxide dehydrogenase medium subunit
VAEAVALLQRFGAEAKLLAGGHSLLPVMKLRLAEPGHLIDIGRIDELRGVRLDGDRLRIGALATHRELERDPTLRQHALVLAEAAAVVGDRQVRNRGTLGGALAHADAAADEPAAVLALDGELVAVGPNGERTVAAGDFFVDFLTTTLAPDEVLTEIRLPVAPPRTGMSYQKVANQASGYALVGVAAVVTLDESGRCAGARVAITAPPPRRAAPVRSRRPSRGRN